MPKGKPHPAELKARVSIEVMHGEKMNLNLNLNLNLPHSR